MFHTARETLSVVSNNMHDQAGQMEIAGSGAGL